MNFGNELSNEQSHLCDLDQSDLAALAPNLYLGSLEGVTRAIERQPDRFSHVLSCINSFPDIPEGVTHLALQIEANPLGGSHAEFQKAVEFIHSGLKLGGVVAVHCEMGTSRSPAVLAAYLTYANGIDLKEAIKQVYDCRQGVQINPWIMGDLKKWAGELPHCPGSISGCD